MRVELAVAGHEVNFVSINKHDGVATQEEMVKHCAFPQLQDTEELDIWGQMGGGKDDFYIYDADGTRYASPVGRFKTAPAADADLPVRFAVVSCQDYVG
ncbi:MAG: hypothetical protein QF464_12805, partial [Myxococcota bacterium]|nr:hypothetical protein [Myxococcota bacterium]